MAGSQVKAQSGPDHMKTLYSRGPRIQDQHVAPGVTHHLEYMRMTADKEVRTVSVHKFTRTWIIFSGISAYMGHQHLHALAFEKAVQRMNIAQFMVITVAGHADKGLELRQLSGQFHAAAEISGMPYLVNRLEELPELRVKDSMRIGYQTYIHIISQVLHTRTFAIRGKRVFVSSHKITIFAGKTTGRMELFYSQDIAAGICRLGQDESAHCIKVLRHRCGDEISVIDGQGTLYRCRITSDSPKGVEAMVTGCEQDWGGHPYRLHAAVCPTKNNDRYEWFAEKACETGIDEITPVIGDHSERRVFKTARLEKILVSAAKQSLKGAVPKVNEPVSVRDFIEMYGNSSGTLKLIAYCFEDESVPRRNIKEVLEGFQGWDIIILIGPEGDFSPAEAGLAIANGFIPVHLGPSRLRTETAALTAVTSTYLRYI